MDHALLAEVSKHEWYQSIKLADGVVTPGETGDATQRKLDMMALPGDLSGRTVLDIGCNEGFFSFEAERRGASRVLAIDKGKAAREKFDLVHRILDSRVEFRAVDFMDLKSKDVGRFDLVFFLAVFHHLRHPFAALDRIFDLTGEMAVMEFVEAVPEVDQQQSFLVRRLSKKGHLHWLPTRTLLMELLDQAGFARTEILGTHRAKSAGPHRKMPGFGLQRVLLKAMR